MAEEWAGERIGRAGSAAQERRAKMRQKQCGSRQRLRAKANFMNLGLSAFGFDAALCGAPLRGLHSGQSLGRRSYSGSGAALAGGFVEDDGSCGGDVERTDAAGHGDAQQMVAGAADKIVQAGAFAAEDEDQSPVKSNWSYSLVPRSSSPMIQRFCCLSSSRARTRLTTRAMRRCSAAPALALTATGLSGAARRSVRTTPSTPAPSATRRSAPRFCGLQRRRGRGRDARRVAGWA